MPAVRISPQLVARLGTLMNGGAQNRLVGGYTLSQADRDYVEDRVPRIMSALVGANMTDGLLSPTEANFVGLMTAIGRAPDDSAAEIAMYNYARERAGWWYGVPLYPGPGPGFPPSNP